MLGIMITTIASNNKIYSIMSNNLPCFLTLEHMKSIMAMTTMSTTIKRMSLIVVVLDVVIFHH